jgi:hypothetical protein
MALELTHQEYEELNLADMLFEVERAFGHAMSSRCHQRRRLESLAYYGHVDRRRCHH